MLLRIATLGISAIAMFYALEGVGVLPRGEYFPSLPRLESSAASPSAWLGAAAWGVKWVACASGKGGLATCAHALDGRSADASTASTDGSAVSDMLLQSAAAPAVGATLESARQNVEGAVTRFTDRVASRSSSTKPL
jgi:hypothetical protein